MNEECARIKNALEQAYDVPFEVNGSIQDGDPLFEIAPENDSQELFRLSVTFKNATRVIINFIPEKYSAPLIKDMSEAPQEKKRLFAQYAGILIKERFAQIDFVINGIKCNPCVFEDWPVEWRDFSCRITRSPVAGDDEEFKLADLTIDWGGIALGMFLSLMNVVPTTTDAPELVTGHTEGKSYQVVSTRYERSLLNRKFCIALKGYTCAICGFDFCSFYGDVGEGFIEVHHIEPVSLMDIEKTINPETDLIPVCSNCHSILHRRTPPYSPEDIISLISGR